ncbi:RNA-binding domain-containing protein [Gimesia sp.]|uniref:AlbA family DNA-binding domain-containing protein n=1 Tax=Gimesia sp. TaxID=2024833 RepID=UPI0032EEF747
MSDNLQLDNNKVEELLSRMEGNTIDFKQAQYDFTASDTKDQKRKRAEFVKDIISMYNTPRDENSYIILGVNKKLDNSYEITGISSHIDDAELQSKFTDWIHPIPRFYYLPYEYCGKQIGLIIIPPDKNIGPCLPSKDLPSYQHQTLRQHQIYFRRNSMNDIATADDQKLIFSWFSNEQPSKAIPEGAHWDDLIDEMGDFSPKYYYGLIVTKLKDKLDELPKALGLIDWAFVIDFDNETDSSGLLSLVQPVINSRRSVHLVTKGDTPSINIENGTYWYCANGISGRSETIPASEKFYEWNKMYGFDLQHFFHSLARVATSRPISILVLWDSNKPTESLNSIMTNISATFGESLNGAMILESPSSQLQAIADNFHFSNFIIPTSQLCFGIKHLMSKPDNTSSVEVSLPSSSGAPIPIPNNKLAWLSEELQILHLAEGQRSQGVHETGAEFLRGNEISWYEIGLNYDVTRDLTNKVIRTVRSDLGSRGSIRINLYHAPGAGGTTIARRIMWDLHTEYPCMQLLRTTPNETSERLKYIGSLTNKAMLLVVDAGAISDREADALYEAIAANHLPIVLLQVTRRFGKPKEQKRALYLESELSPSEADKFVHFLEREEPSRGTELRHVIQEATPETVTPFYLALVAFGRNFVRLSDYISIRIEALSENQKKCICYMALAHFFGQRAIPILFFAEEFGVPSNRPIKMNSLFPSSTLELLVEVKPNYWRTVHPLVAEECMRQIFTPNNADQEAWGQYLSKWSIQFIDFCRGTNPLVSDESLDIVRQVFVFRDNSEILGSERAGTVYFSESLEKIPSPEGRLEVLKYLTQSFPEEAHFWAHLGRFLSTVLKEHNSALESVEHAISLQPNDHILHHMKGMVIRAYVYQLISEKKPIEDVVDHAANAANSFLQARDLEPDDEHGYISDVQMCLKILDYCGETQKSKPIIAATNPSTPKWVRERVEYIEDLLLQVRQNREGEKPSRFEEKCRADLSFIYGDHSTALQRWDSMLTRQDVYSPPIRRQIIWAYLSRGDRKWTSLKNSEIERSLKLLNDNLDEEPNNERNLRLWLQAIRMSLHPPSLDTVIEKLAYWRANSDTLEPVFYLFVAYSLKAIEGSSLAKDNALKCLEECSIRSRYRRNRSKSFEWLGIGDGLKRLIHQDSLGDWDSDKQFWTDPSKLERVNGIIRRIQGPESGELEIDSGLRAFFVPARSGHYKGESENRRITCFIGFSYDGLRAWSVKDQI